MNALSSLGPLTLPGILQNQMILAPAPAEDMRPRQGFRLIEEVTPARAVPRPDVFARGLDARATLAEQIFRLESEGGASTSALVAAQTGGAGSVRATVVLTLPDLLSPTNPVVMTLEDNWERLLDMRL